MHFADPTITELFPVFDGWVDSSLCFHKKCQIFIPRTFLQLIFKRFYLFLEREGKGDREREK